MSPLLDEQLAGIWNACVASNAIIKLLPESDLVEELKELLETQQEILKFYLRGRHYGSDRLDNFADYASAVLEEIDAILNETGETKESS